MELSEAYKFCPRCAAEFKKSGGLLKCHSCGLSFYLNPKPVQSVILKSERDEYLFAVRALEPKAGYLDFPGGFVEENENFEETSRRELREELGIEIGELQYLSSHVDEYLYQGINYKVSGVAYLAKLPPEADIKPADDVASVEFYALDKIPMERLAWKSMHEMVDELKKKAKS